MSVGKASSPSPWTIAVACSRSKKIGAWLDTNINIIGFKVYPFLFLCQILCPLSPHVIKLWRYTKRALVLCPSWYRHLLF